MSDVKRIDIGEFQEIGFLQEANRLFFHPHGLALEIVSVTDNDKALSTLELKPAEMDLLRLLVANSAGTGEMPEELAGISAAINEARTLKVGDKWLGGIWDYRDDPEGIVFGSGGYGDSAARAERVSDERFKHFDTRCKLFDQAAEENGDIEPLDWTYPA